VTIAKAGIHAKLNARCSVLAAANPVYGRYDPFKTPMDNIGMQDSLLSRFDLLFIVLDNMEPESDRKISEHVLRMHKYRTPGEQDGDPLPFGDTTDVLATFADEEEESEEGTQVYAKADAQLYGTRRSKKDKFVSIPFMKKYIHVAKNIKPALTQEAADLISNAYTDLRDQEGLTDGMAKTSPVTPRTLETLIRLSTSHAKARMSKTVEEGDAEAAIEMVEFAYFHKVETREKKKKPVEEDEEEEEAEAGDSQPAKKRASKKKAADEAEADEPVSKSMKKLPKPGEAGYDPYDFDQAEDDARPDTKRKKKPSQEDEAMETDAAPAPPSDTISDQKFQVFRTCLQATFSQAHQQTLPLDDILDALRKDYPDMKFSDAEVRAATTRMTDDNHIMLSDGQVFLV